MQSLFWISKGIGGTLKFEDINCKLDALYYFLYSIREGSANSMDVDILNLDAKN